MSMRLIITKGSQQWVHQLHKAFQKKEKEFENFPRNSKTLSQASQSFPKERKGIRKLSQKFENHPPPFKD
jgi:nucleoid-associated protein YejK